MSAIVLDSRAVADEYLEWIRTERATFPFAPTLATLVYRPGADAASIQYRDLMLKDAERLGLQARSHEAHDEDGVLRKIDEINADPAVHGLVVLYPLRSRLFDDDVMDRVSPYKDAEGLHSINLGYLIKYRRFLDEARQAKCVVPATPKAVVKALQRYPDVKLEGAFAVIVNNSMRVGKPLGLMLENLGATVVKCYDKTRPEVLEKCVREADILVTAVPDPAFHIPPEWVKDGAAVVDVSYQGNIDARSLRERASLVTVAENRPGRITRAMMFVNLIYCARYKGLYY
ncbi:MAG: bifunctional 5,10-methylenetetrahydrofolate dehydrogenase/5,10-methenyltetrahydrofolate cyclohydrolase [Elusimicrobia bacterium]|nr:bifunctional 5,10-methylenetetrahydrofolate dehydrogenase/5,10-methenyltetrahydrofolate cyclohydrolase [Elusimicrobiota bacterium]